MLLQFYADYKVLEDWVMAEEEGPSNTGWWQIEEIGVGTWKKQIFQQQLCAMKTLHRIIKTMMKMSEQTVGHVRLEMVSTAKEFLDFGIRSWEAAG